MCVGRVWVESSGQKFPSTTFIIIHGKMEFYHLLLIQALGIYSNHQYCFQTTYKYHGLFQVTEELTFCGFFLPFHLPSFLPS